MAGTYLHLLLARQALQRLDANVELQASAASFYAGVLGPDIGFFPAGPRRFSDAIHQHHCGDVVRQLAREAQNADESAFATGWALHVYTDLAVHPEIDARAHRLQRERPMAAGSDVWHKRIEWGLDCRVLEEAPIRLWHSPLTFPFDGSTTNVLHRATVPWFGSLADPTALAVGAAATVRWTRRLAPALLWTGGCARADRSLLCRGVAAIAHPVARRLSRAWEQTPARDDEVAILNPLRESEDLVLGLRKKASASVDDFVAGINDGHAHLANRDLSTGECSGPRGDV